MKTTSFGVLSVQGDELQRQSQREEHRALAPGQARRDSFYLMHAKVRDGDEATFATRGADVRGFYEQGQLLLAHATGQKHWDIPKGGAEAGESAREAAIREVREETGIELAADSMEEIGHMRTPPGRTSTCSAWPCTRAIATSRHAQDARASFLTTLQA